jgi:hypothetical protein
MSVRFSVIIASRKRMSRATRDGDVSAIAAWYRSSPAAVRPCSDAATSRPAMLRR